MSERVTVVDYGIGNVFSVCNALSRIGAEPHLASDPRDIAGAERLILPGVGAFSRAMENLSSRGHVEAIATFVETGRPFLGICIGMQLLMEVSTEFGEHAGLGHIAGKVDLIANTAVDGTPLDVPHINWAEVTPTGAGANHPLLADTMDDTGSRYFYFVHSFMAYPDDAAHLLATASYGGRQITAAVGRDNITGLQFHPERSGAAGLALLEKFSFGAKAVAV
ncbi:MAG: imidazole glycerol phosphate synthase subunit HisH [Paracoccaceae bacterium]